MELYYVKQAYERALKTLSDPTRGENEPLGDKGFDALAIVYLYESLKQRELPTIRLTDVRLGEISEAVERNWEAIKTRARYVDQKWKEKYYKDGTLKDRRKHKRGDPISTVVPHVEEK